MRTSSDQCETDFSCPLAFLGIRTNKARNFGPFLSVVRKRGFEESAGSESAENRENQRRLKRVNRLKSLVEVHNRYADFHDLG